MKLFNQTFFLNVPSQSYLLTFWNFKFKLLFKGRLKFSLRQCPILVKTYYYSNYSYEAFSTKLFLNVPHDIPHKSYLLAFWNFKLKLFVKKKQWNLRLWLMESKAHRNWMFDWLRVNGGYWCEHLDGSNVFTINGSPPSSIRPSRTIDLFLNRPMH